MQIKKLEEIARISSGHSFRRRIEYQENGRLLVVTGKDIGNTFYLQKKDLTKIDKEVHQDKLIEQGDVLLSARGKFKAVVSSVKENLIAASSVYVLKIDKDVLLPEYLVLWLNSKIGQAEINKKVTGATIKILLKKDLENIKIEVPELIIQREIVEFYKTTQELKDKLKIKSEKVENIFEGALAKMIKSKTKK